MRVAPNCPRLTRDAAANGIDMCLVGSLARGDFRAHSDVDLLVRRPLDPGRRLLAERLVADGMRGTHIPYDLIFEADLTEDRLRELLHDIVLEKTRDRDDQIGGSDRPPL